MISLRHNRFWLVWLVGLTLITSGVLAPAQAFACAEGSMQKQSAKAESQPRHCAEMGQKASCCCGSGAKVANAHHTPVGVALTARGCGCSVQAPDVPPTAVTRSAALVFAPEAALLPVSTLEIELPRSAPWVYAAPANGPPPGATRSSGPSRAPPAP